MNWQDLALFAAVARAGALARAAEETGVSVPTLSRRMKALEGRLGRRLFLHGAQGYAVTADGRELLSRAERMEAAAAEVESWQARGGGPVRVRITCGTWTAERLARSLAEWWSPDAGWSPDFVHCNLDMDVARREVDIGVRNRRPSQPWLAGRRTGSTHYAAYAAAPEVSGWIGGSREAAPLPSERWIAETHPEGIVATANDPRLRLALAEQGLGRIVLPVWAGDGQPGLMRVSDVIEPLTSEEWIVSHHEARHDPPIRAALNAIGDFLSRRTA